MCIYIHNPTHTQWNRHTYAVLYTGNFWVAVWIKIALLICTKLVASGATVEWGTLFLFLSKVSFFYCVSFYEIFLGFLETSCLSEYGHLTGGTVGYGADLLGIYENMYIFSVYKFNLCASHKANTKIHVNKLK